MDRRQALLGMAEKLPKDTQESLTPFMSDKPGGAGFQQLRLSVSHGSVQVKPWRMPRAQQEQRAESREAKPGRQTDRPDANPVKQEAKQKRRRRLKYPRGGR
jgi:hypothetical protein